MMVSTHEFDASDNSYGVRSVELRVRDDGVLSVMVETAMGYSDFVVSSREAESLLGISYVSKANLQRLVLELSIKIHRGEIP